MFTGEGAQKIAKEFGIENVDDSYLITEKAKERFLKHSNFDPAAKAMFYDRE